MSGPAEHRRLPSLVDVVAVLGLLALYLATCDPQLPLIGVAVVLSAAVLSATFVRTVRVLVPEPRVDGTTSRVAELLPEPAPTFSSWSPASRGWSPRPPCAAVAR